MGRRGMDGRTRGAEAVGGGVDLRAGEGSGIGFVCDSMV